MFSTKVGLPNALWYFLRPLHRREGEGERTGGRPSSPWGRAGKKKTDIAVGSPVVPNGKHSYTNYDNSLCIFHHPKRPQPSEMACFRFRAIWFSVSSGDKPLCIPAAVGIEEPDRIPTAVGALALQRQGGTLVCQRLRRKNARSTFGSGIASTHNPSCDLKTKAGHSELDSGARRVILSGNLNRRTWLFRKDSPQGGDHGPRIRQASLPGAE